MLGFLESPKSKKTSEEYRTLSFKTKKQANKNLKEIKEYFDKKILNIGIDKGIDERGNSGFYVWYLLNN
jgi:hypothetical protein